MVWTVVGTTAMSGRSPAKALIASRELQRVTTWNSVPVSTFRLRIDARMKPGIPESLGNVSLLRWRIYASAWSGLAFPFQCLDIIVLPSYNPRQSCDLVCCRQNAPLSGRCEQRERRPAGAGCWASPTPARAWQPEAASDAAQRARGRTAFAG